MTQIQTIDPIEYPGWDELLLTNKQASFFHSSDWARVLSYTYKYKPLYFCVIKENFLNALIPIMNIKSAITGRRGVSLPFTDFSHSFSIKDDLFVNLVQHINQFGVDNGWKSVEYRGSIGTENNFFSSANFLVHILKLNDDENIVFKSFKSNTRRNIKRALKSDIRAQLTFSLQSMKDFYYLNCLTRKKHGLPPQPWSFFLNIYKYVISKGKGFICLATHHKRPVAASVYFYDETAVIYKYGASHRSYLTMRPNNIVMWKAIQWGCRQGLKYFHFGRTEPSNFGLLQFKRSWGAKEKKLEYFKYDFKKKEYINQKDELNSSYLIFRYMPLPFLRLAGLILYRHIG